MCQVDNTGMKSRLWQIGLHPCGGAFDSHEGGAANLPHFGVWATIRAADWSQLPGFHLNFHLDLHFLVPLAFLSLLFDRAHWQIRSLANRKSLRVWVN